MNGNEINHIYERFFFDIDTHREPGIQGGIKSYDEYQVYVNTGSGKGKTILYKKIDLLRSNLAKKYGEGVDPIHYIMQLYYGDELGFGDVYTRLEKLGFTYKNGTSGLEKLFKSPLGWQARDTSGGEVTRKKKAQLPHIIESMSKAIEQKSAVKCTLIEDTISAQVNNIIEGSFQAAVFENLKTNSKKMLYLLQCYKGVNITTLENLNQQGVGARILARQIQIIIDEATKNYGIELLSINYSTINDLLRQNKNT